MNKLMTVLRRAGRRRALGLLAFTLVSAGQGAAMAQGPSTVQAQDTDRAATIVRRFWDAFNRAAWAELDDLVTPGYAHHPPGKTLNLAQFKAGGAWVHKGLAGYKLQIDSLVATDKDVAIRWTARGTHVASFFGETPASREVTVQGMHFHAIADGRIAEDWEVIDFDGFKAQLGRPQAEAKPGPGDPGPSALGPVQRLAQPPLTGKAWPTKQAAASLQR